MSFPQHIETVVIIRSHITVRVIVDEAQPLSPNPQTPNFCLFSNFGIDKGPIWPVYCICYEYRILFDHIWRQF